MAPAPRRGGRPGGGSRFCHANGKSSVHPSKPPCGGGARGGHVAAELPAVRTIAGRCVTPIRGQAGAGAVRHESSPRGERKPDFLRDVSAGPNSTCSRYLVSCAGSWQRAAIPITIVHRPEKY